MGNLCSITLSIDDLISRWGDCTVSLVHYVSRFEENLNILRIALQELKEFRNDVKREVDVTERQPMMKRLDQVQGWLLLVESMETEVNELIENSTQVIESNYISRYKLGKKVAKKIEDVATLQSKGVFQVVAKRLPSAAVNVRPSKPTVGMEMIFGKIWSHFQEEHVGLIGLYGLGGVGKTTLLTQINNKFANTDHDFDVVIWVEVSQAHDMDNVQNEIGKMIGLYDERDETWKSKSLGEKAIDIHGVLSQKKFVLLLDDLWERIDLPMVGIPLPNGQNKSKIAFTTRSEEVCGEMEAQKKIKVECLPWEKAWVLFQLKVGEVALNSDPVIPELAKLVAKECGGLPLAIVTVGRAMACKSTSQEWEYAIEVLKKYAVEFPGMENDVFGPLNFSYESLPSDIVKDCFLYCSLFPEDSCIAIEKLIEYWIGEGFLKECDGNDDRATNQGYHIIGTLLHACLLDKVSSFAVKMHDVIREMALWIGCKYGKQPDRFLVRAGVMMTGAPEVSKWKGVKRMSLMKNKIEKLTETPMCPELTTLFLNLNSLKMISSGFFQFMHALKVLDLSHNFALVSLPLEICKLISLQYLNLSWTKIRHLPDEFQNLVRLKCLVLEYATNLDPISLHVISSLSSLQMLKMFRSVVFDEELLETLEDLKCLNDLSLDIKDVTAFQRLSSSHKLQSCTRLLSLGQLRYCTSFDISSLENMERLDRLHLDYFLNCEDFVINWTLEQREIKTPNDPHNSHIKTRRCFHRLHNVLVSFCPRLKNLTWLLFAPNLKSLHVNGCENMEEVISGGAQMEVAEVGKIPKPFAKLEILVLESLPKLKSIYPSLLPFPFLNSIHVSKCPELKRLPFNFDSAKEHPTVIRGSKKWWDELEWQDEATRNVFVPCANFF
ncbi:unnamed protein product [Ilex paraguariensis]|uniref:NB-ARC domain-containing protein n=1 Tax=Ilex paraguariensis TaxID=185542 RepID=A0ABC8U4H6_9AQUA